MHVIGCIHRTESEKDMAGTEPERVKVLREAADLIDGDRNVSYGTPTQNFTNIAEMWTTRLRHKLKDGTELDAVDVADLMILLKVARNIAQVKRDSYVDVAGYAGCGWEAAQAGTEQRPAPFAAGGIINVKPNEFRAELKK